MHSLTLKTSLLPRLSGLLWRSVHCAAGARATDQRLQITGPLPGRCKAPRPTTPPAQRRVQLIEAGGGHDLVQPGGPEPGRGGERADGHSLGVRRRQRLAALLSGLLQPLCRPQHCSWRSSYRYPEPGRYLPLANAGTAAAPVALTSQVCEAGRMEEARLAR